MIKEIVKTKYDFVKCRESSGNRGSVFLGQ